MNIILYPPNNPIALSILNLDIRWYGVIMALSMFIGILLCAHIFKKNLPQDDYNTFIDIIPVVIIFAILGARFFYVIGDWEFYSKHLEEIIFINHGGLSIYGALLAGISTIFYYSRKKKFNMLKYCDCIALVMPLCQAIGRWGNFINQEAYGAPCNGLFKMFIDEHHRLPEFSNISYYHPAFLYESILNIFAFCILFFIFKKYKNIKAGTIFALYLLLYSIIRIIVENVRIDSILNVSGVPVAIIISLFIALFSTILLFRIHKQ
ncbi:prolipoprotein diacylglyceryl transferase [bacterium]|nr:prolipoprotein diacylglyceryl transferase [bacterium]